MTTDFWELFGRAHEIFNNRHSFTDAEQAAFDNLVKTYRRFDDSKLQSELDALKNQLEVDRNVWIVENIISPLLGESGQCLLNDRHGASVKKLKTKGEGKQISVVKGLGIGHKEAWYGEPDAMVGPSYHLDGKCGYRGSSQQTVVGGPDEEVPTSDESAMEVEDSDTNDGGDSPGNNLMIEGKRRDTRRTFEGLHYSQSIATAISFSFTYKEKHNSLGSLIPTLQISRDNFTVFMYDSVNDYLFGAIFRWTWLSLIYLWVVLHYRLFQRSTFSLDNVVCSGYREESDRKGGLTKLNNFIYKANLNQLQSEELTRDLSMTLYASTR